MTPIARYPIQYDISKWETFTDERTVILQLSCNIATSNRRSPATQAGRLGSFCHEVVMVLAVSTSQQSLGCEDWIIMMVYGYQDRV